MQRWGGLHRRWVNLIVVAVLGSALYIAGGSSVPALFAASLSVIAVLLAGLEAGLPLYAAASAYLVLMNLADSRIAALLLSIYLAIYLLEPFASFPERVYFVRDALMIPLSLLLVAAGYLYSVFLSRALSLSPISPLSIIGYEYSGPAGITLIYVLVFLASLGLLGVVAGPPGPGRPYSHPRISVLASMVASSIKRSPGLLSKTLRFYLVLTALTAGLPGIASVMAGAILETLVSRREPRASLPAFSAPILLVAAFFGDPASLASRLDGFVKALAG